MPNDMREAIVEQFRLGGDEFVGVAGPAVILFAGAPVAQQQVALHVVEGARRRAGGTAFGMGVGVVGLDEGIHFGALGSDGQVDEANRFLIVFQFQPIDEIEPALWQNVGALLLVVFEGHQAG